jgi:hypothetical protein
MIDYETRILELLNKKQCCAQIVMTIGLEEKGEKNTQLVQAMKGLCYGLHCQHDCGAVSGGACLLAIHSQDLAVEMTKELVVWFTERYSSVNCSDILGNGNKNPGKCLGIIRDTICQCFEILENHNL